MAMERSLVWTCCISSDLKCPPFGTDLSFSTIHSRKLLVDGPWNVGSAHVLESPEPEPAQPSVVFVCEAQRGQDGRRGRQGPVRGYALEARGDMKDGPRTRVRTVSRSRPVKQPRPRSRALADITSNSVPCQPFHLSRTAGGRRGHRNRKASREIRGRGAAPRPRPALTLSPDPPPG